MLMIQFAEDYHKEKIHEMNEYLVKNYTMFWQELTEEQQQPYIDKAISILGDTYVCTRVWEAWSVGTMTEDDFQMACEDDDVVADVAEKLYEMFHKTLD